MSWTITAEQKFKGLLDNYKGAAAAYSLRSLTYLKGDPVVRVRRSSDSAEQDFTAAQVIDGTLTTFCGAGNGFVSIWYDQSVNGNHVSQTTASNQPQIVTNGALNLLNTKPTLVFSNGPFLQASDSTSLRPVNFTLVTVHKSTDVTTTQIVVSKGNGGSYVSSYTNVIISSTARSYISSSGFTEAFANAGSIANGTNYLQFSGFSGSSVYTSLNGGSNVSTSTALSVGYSNGTLRIGRLSEGSYPMKGSISEVILWSSDLQANKSSIVSDINTYHAIY